MCTQIILFLLLFKKLGISVLLGTVRVRWLTDCMHHNSWTDKCMDTHTHTHTHTHQLIKIQTDSKNMFCGLYSHSAFMVQPSLLSQNSMWNSEQMFGWLVPGIGLFLFSEVLWLRQIMTSACFAPEHQCHAAENIKGLTDFSITSSVVAYQVSFNTAWFLSFFLFFFSFLSQTKLKWK